MGDYNAGALAASGGVGSPILGMRQDTPAQDPKATANLEFARMQMDSGGNVRISHEGGKTTYRATSQFSSDSTATDIAVFAGNATTTVKVLTLKISTTATAAAIGDVTIIRRTAVDTGQTAVSAALGLLDGRDAVPASTPQHFTAHPTGLGAAATNPNLGCSKLFQGTAALKADVLVFDWRAQSGERHGVRLSGTTDILALNVPAALGGAGNTWDLEWSWTEEPLTA